MSKNPSITISVMPEDTVETTRTKLVGICIKNSKSRPFSERRTACNVSVQFNVFASNVQGTHVTWFYGLWPNKKRVEDLQAGSFRYILFAERLIKDGSCHLIGFDESGNGQRYRPEVLKDGKRFFVQFQVREDGLLHCKGSFALRNISNDEFRIDGIQQERTHDTP